MTAPEGRALGAAITALLTGASYAASAEMAGDPASRRKAPSPGYAVNREAMLRVIRNHRRAAYGESAGYEGLSIPPVALDAAQLPRPATGRGGALELGHGALARREIRLP